MKTTQLRRRALLAGLGLGALAPLVPLLESEADTPGPVKRLLLFYSPFGTLYDSWRPSGGETDFSFTGPITAPLEPLKSDLVVLDGLQVTRTSNGCNPHFSQMATLWTGSSQILDTGWAGGISIDQHIANQLDVQTPLRSLELAVDTFTNDAASRMIYAGPNQPLTPYSDPSVAFDAIFASVATEPDTLARLRAERKSVLDLASKHLGRLQGKVSTQDRYKIDAHLTAVGALEKKLLGMGAACTPGAHPGPIDPADSHYFMELARAQVDIMVMAMACDLTRIGSIQLKDENGGMVYWIGTDADFHSLSHDPANAAPWLELAYHDFTVIFAELVQKLKDTPAASGGSLLDSTLVAWGCAIANGEHRWIPTPFVLAGSAGGAFQTGRNLYYDSYDNCTSCTEHYRLLVSICNAMGVPAMNGDRVGDQDMGSGPLPKLA